MTARRRLNVHSAARVTKAEHHIRNAIRQLEICVNQVRRDPDLSMYKATQAENELLRALIELGKAKENEPFDDEEDE